MDFPLSKLPGIGKARLAAFEAAGIRSVRELLVCLPKDYRDLTRIVPLSEMRPGMEAAVRVFVAGTPTVYRTGKLAITRVYVEDDTERMAAVWYNQPWLKQALYQGRELLLYGRVEAKKGYMQLTCPSIEKEGGIIPVYKPIPGVPNKTLKTCVEAALALCDGQWPDQLPESLRRRYGLCERNFAMRNAHMPVNRDALQAARRRLAFEELLVYQIGLGLMRAGGRKGVRIDVPDGAAQKFINALPFPLTGAQKRVIAEIEGDLKGETAMARLVQGDVGSGKTAVAFAAIAMAVQSGWQAAMMAPTEILAQQHYEGAKTLFEPLGYRVGLLIGSLTAKQHRIAHEAIAAGEWDVVIGTHALITDKVTYNKLGLVVTDEQHRFGVRQRSMLSEKGDSPNVLVMSATPIPRTLSLILYGDLDISVIDELPPGRIPVKTRVVPDSRREGMYGFLRKEIADGRQVYVVCPLVEESEAVEASSAEQVYADLSSGPLKDVRVALVHGRMKPDEKERALADFRDGTTDVLVSTTVIEVGVNVPNATVMVIENAERFGLAQLHQLRGRVGRGSEESWCFLMAEPNERLKLLTQTNDGFIIAQKDMEIRGPGEMFGNRQSGVMSYGITAMAADAQMLKQTHDEARELLKNPDSDEAQAVIALAREVFADRMQEIALN